MRALAILRLRLLVALGRSMCRRGECGFSWRFVGWGSLAVCLNRGDIADRFGLLDCALVDFGADGYTRCSAVRVESARYES